MKDKIVFITGASSGIGAATAKAFAKRGARLFLTGRNAENLSKTASECHSAGLPQTHIHCETGDLSKEEDVKRVAQSVIDKYETVDVLVNNAGILKYNTIQEGSLDDLDAQYRIHVRAVYSLCQKLVPKLIERKGCIVNVSSVASTVPIYYTTGYCSMKAAQDHLTRCLALELAPKKVRVNSVSPGIARSDIHERAGMTRSATKFYDKMGDTYPLGRVGEVEEMAEAILYLASDNATFITGSNLVLDGGYSLKGGL